MDRLFRGSPSHFLAGFLVASVVTVAVYSVISGVPTDFSFLVPMMGVGLFGGFLWMRRPPAFLSKRREP